MATDLPLKKATVVITGAKGVGKTFLAATYAPPDMLDQVFWHDSERSANTVVQRLGEQGLKFGHYRNLTSRFDKLPGEKDLLARIAEGDLPWVSRDQKNALEDYYEYVTDDLNKNMAKGQYKVYVHDTIETLEAGMAAWVASDRRRAGFTSTAHGRMWSEAVYPLYEHLIEALYDRGVETVILTTHLKTPWENNQPVPNAVQPSGKKILYKLSSLMIWLVNEGAAPAGLVLKERLGNLRPVNGEWVAQRMLPQRIPICTWSEIRRYLREGCDLNSPGPGEEMSKVEQEMISDMLSDRQMELMILTAKQKLEGADTRSLQPEPPPEVLDAIESAKAEAEQMVEDGKAEEEIREYLMDNYSIPIAMQAMKSIGG